MPKPDAPSLRTPPDDAMQADSGRRGGKVYAIGDVHGCRRELELLLEALSPGEDDLLIFVGDLINRGPDSHGVLEIVRQLRGAYCLLGNHELRLLRYHEKGDASRLKPYDFATIASLTPEDWAFLKTFHLSLHFPGLETVFVHAGFIPGKPWEKQGANIITRVQVVNRKTGEYGKRAEVPKGITWMQYWKGPPFVICGHTPRRKVVRSRWAMCLDTGCVYGGKLSAYELTEQRLFQVQALEAYVGKTLNENL